MMAATGRNMYLLSSFIEHLFRYYVLLTDTYTYCAYRFCFGPKGGFLRLGEGYSFLVSFIAPVL